MVPQEGDSQNGGKPMSFRINERGEEVGTFTKGNPNDVEDEMLEESTDEQ